ncbi:RNA-binding domain-containing protein [Clavulina sp. PMI_390]|nr:RNA-binding domain-containing protein [Clavulina sp. PMI_390]
MSECSNNPPHFTAPRRDGSFKAFFHASFSDPVLASDAREILESQFKNNGIRIDYALDSKPTPSQGPPAVEDITPCADLYIGNLPFDATETDMMAALDDVKGFQELYISRDSYGRNKGSARATFDSVHHASEALNILDGRTVMDRPMRVNYSNRRSTRPSGPATPLLFIGGLPRNVTEQMVHDALAGFDGLKGIEIFNLTNREKSPFAHARYETADQAKLVIQACHWKPLFAGGPPMRIDFHYEKKPIFTGQPDAHPPSPVLFVGGIGDRSVKDLLELFASFSPVSARAGM